MQITDYLKEGISLQSAVEEAAKRERQLFFPPGEYHVDSNGCVQRYCYFSNNDEGVKTIALNLENLDDFTVSGYGALLVFHGRISPLCAFNCKSITVEGLSIDFVDSFVSDADLICRDDGMAWFRFSGKHQVKNGRMVFTEDCYDNLGGYLQFFPYLRDRKELQKDVRPFSIPNKNVRFRDGLVGFKDKFGAFDTDAFIVKHEQRLCPGMVFDGCKDIRIRDVTIYHAAGMGFLIQNSENCLIDGAVVEPRNRRASVSDDALHITDCRGKLLVKNGRFSGTLDDAINIHGVFRKLKSRIPGGKMFYLEAGHYQQQGVFNVRKDDVLELLHRETGEPYAQLKLTQVTPINKSIIKVDFDEGELPNTFVQGDPAWILGTQAELDILETECRPLNGRGILASGMKRVRISGCTIHSSCAGVFISGDHGFWYESGPVKEAVIENNLFDNCDYYDYGATQEPLAVFPELETLQEGFFYHGSIQVKNNLFRSARRPLISILSAAEVTVSDNLFQLDDTYPFRWRNEDGYHFTTPDSPPIALKHCGSVHCQDFSVIPSI